MLVVIVHLLSRSAQQGYGDNYKPVMFLSSNKPMSEMMESVLWI